MPPLPVFLAAAIGAGTAVICAALTIAERFADARLIRALVVTGQAALTWYLLHIVVGLGTVQALGLIGKSSAAVGAATGMGVFAAMVFLTWLWRRRFRHGPLEGLMRRVAG
jgi:uncharacterized membrane protein YeiB